MRGFHGKTLQQQNVWKDKNKEGAVSSIHLVNPNYTINTIQVYGQEKYLVMREVDIFSLSDKLTDPELMCDVICLMYDLNNPRSFEYIARIYLKHFNDCKLPILVVGSKSDQICVRQQYTLQPEEFCAKYKLPKAHLFSVNQLQGVPQEVYVKLGTMAAYPNLRRLVHVLLMRPSGSWVSQNLQAIQAFLPEASTLVRTGVGLASLAIAGLFIVRLLRAVNLQSNNR
jgi:Ras family protein T1